jgi:tRNA threonylcarbamoyladenosine biosynthesis protein TsaB
MKITGPILAIETSTATARVAIVDSSGLRRAAREATAARHSSNLLRLCDETLREAAVDPAGLGAIACGAGPGSFTGLRVGLAVGKGLALPTERPFVLISSLASLALDILTAPGGAGVVAAPCIDAGKGQIYVAFFRADPTHLVAPLSEEWVINPGDLVASAPPDVPGTLLVAGNGAARYAETIDALLAATRPDARRIDVAGPSADSLARLALLRLARGESDSLEAAVPSYGRPPDITRPRRP